MKKILFLINIMLAFAAGAFASSRVVMESGSCTTCSPPIYGSISAAVAASSAGDTIFIKSRAGDVPYVENVTITQSLDFVPYYNDSLWYCQGTWTISPLLAGSIIDIVGMVNVNGSVIATGAAPSGTRTTVRLLGGQLGFYNGGVTASGYVSFNYNYYDVTVYGMKIFSSGTVPITMMHGSVIGDSIISSGAHGIYYNTDGITSNDTAMIVGNIINVLDGNGYNGYYAIYWNSTSEIFDMRNNLIFNNDNGIYITQTRNTISPINKIYNCTIDWNAPSGSNDGKQYTYGYPSYAMRLNPTSPGVIEVQNNLIVYGALNSPTASDFHGINIGASGVNLYYNYIDNKYGASYEIDGGSAPSINSGSVFPSGPIALGSGNISSIAPPVSGVANAAPAGTSLGYQTLGNSTVGVNAGNPGLSFANMTGPTSGIYAPFSQNTVGCYGGPYSIQNFFAIGMPSGYSGPTVLNMNMGSTRTFGTTSNPTVTTVGATNFSVKATSFDR